VTAVFGKTGYALSWLARADRLGITPEEPCDRFKTDPNRVKKLGAELTVEKEKAAESKCTGSNPVGLVATPGPLALKASGVSLLTNSYRHE